MENNMISIQTRHVQNIQVVAWQFYEQKMKYFQELHGGAGSQSIQSVIVTMSQWSNEQRAFAVEAYFKTNDSCVSARRRFCSHYNIRRLTDAPSVNLIRTWVQKFRATGSIIKNPHTGPSQISRTEENIQCVGSSMQEKPHHRVSSRRLPKTMVQRILSSESNFILLRSNYCGL